MLMSLRGFTCAAKCVSSIDMCMTGGHETTGWYGDTKAEKAVYALDHSKCK